MRVACAKQATRRRFRQHCEQCNDARSGDACAAQRNSAAVQC